MSINEVTAGENIENAVTQFSNNVFNIDLNQNLIAAQNHQVNFVYAEYDKREYVSSRENTSITQKRYVNFNFDASENKNTFGVYEEFFTTKFDIADSKMFIENILNYIENESYGIFRNTDCNSSRYEIVDFANNTIPPLQNINQVDGEIVTIEQQNIDEFSMVNTVSADFLGVITQNTANDMFNTQNENAAQAIDQAYEIQTTANSTVNSNANQNNVISLKFFTINVQSDKQAIAAQYPDESIIIGYNVYKYDASDEDALIDVTFVSNLYDVDLNANLTQNQIKELLVKRESYQDLNVLMGKKYIYSIFPVFLYARYIEAKLSFAVIESKFYKRFTVNTDDKVRPKPPKLDIMRVSLNALKITWVPARQSNITRNLMPISVNDTKGYIIFSRNTIDDAYNIVKIIDFSDTVGYTNPMYEKIKSVPNTYKVFSDKHITSCFYNIKNDEDYIFTVCAYDARGNLSNLSSQIYVRINSATNVFSKEFLSKNGAQIQQPNLYINHVPKNLDTKIFLTDSFNASKYKKICVYHCPESNNTKKIDYNSSNPNYKLQIIDIFTQQQKIVDLYLEKNETEEDASSQIVFEEIDVSSLEENTSASNSTSSDFGSYS